MNRRWIAGLNAFAVVVALVFMLSATFGLTKLYSMEERLGSGPLANGVWGITQGESRFLNYLNSLQTYIREPQEENREAAMLQLDLMWNRFKVMTSGELGAAVKSMSDDPTVVDRLHEALVFADSRSKPLTPENAEAIFEAFRGIKNDMHVLGRSVSQSARVQYGDMIWDLGELLSVISWGGILALASGLIVISLLYLQYRRASREMAARISAEDVLKVALKDAQAANRAKSEFLAAMSHELRTPLNAILGFSQVIEQAAFGPIGSPKYAEYAHDIRTSGAHLLEIINDILDLSKIEAGELEITPTRFDLSHVIEECSKLIVNRMGTSPDRVVISVSEQAPELTADIRMFRQILINLLSNADKFTPEGGRIHVTTSLEGEDATVVRIADTGIGIAPEDIDRVLEPFGQSRRDVQVTHKGTGLGLSLAKKLTELHGGRLTIESALGVGTTVTISFPNVVADVDDAPTAGQAAG